jgi:predicted transcriptional regulator
VPPTASPFPTAADLEILQVIWQRGPSTVREVFNTLAADREVGYSTVLKFMQIMTDKGTLVRDDTVRPQVYRAARPQKQVQQGILRDLAARAFGGSSASLVMQALSDRKATADERRQIREQLDDLDADPPKRRRACVPPESNALMLACPRTCAHCRPPSASRSPSSSSNPAWRTFRWCSAFGSPRFCFRSP